MAGTATRSEQRLDDAPASVTVLTRDDIGQGARQGLVLVDLSVWRRIARWGEIFVAVENLLDSAYTTGRTGDGVVSSGAPFLVHGGVRLQYR